MMEINDDHIKVALARYLGESRRTAAARVGVTEETVRSWESSKWWPEVETLAAKTHSQKTLGKARRVVNKILDTALEEECAASILNQAANLSRWLIESQDPAFKSQGASDTGAALAKLTRAIDGLTEAELRSLANEQVVFGFPDEKYRDGEEDDEEVPARVDSARGTQATGFD